MSGPVLFRIDAIMILKVHKDKRLHANYDIDCTTNGGIVLNRYMDRATQRSVCIRSKLIFIKFSK